MCAQVAIVCMMTSLVDFPVVYLQESNISLLHALFGDCKEQVLRCLCGCA